MAGRGTTRISLAVVLASQASLCSGQGLFLLLIEHLIISIVLKPIGFSIYLCSNNQQLNKSYMKYNLLGNTGLKVSELCLGTMTFGGKGVFAAIGSLGQQPVDALLKRAIDAGINFIDTANVYSEGLSEELTGQSIHNLGLKRDELVLATKVRGKMGERPNDSGLTRKHIIQQAEASLKRLKTDYIDLYQIHSYDPLTPFEETIGALDDLVKSGKVRYMVQATLLPGS
jgi:aryl-alcohol dehydrogenase-like predicted oxidoreductase